MSTLRFDVINVLGSLFLHFIYTFQIVLSNTENF